MVLADSDVIIDSISPQLPVVRAFFAREKPSASAASVVETLGYHLIRPAEEVLLRQYFAQSTVRPITEAIIQRAVALRQRRKMGLGDALIAATALEHNLTLATRNTADFRHVPGLALVDPLAP